MTIIGLGRFSIAKAQLMRPTLPEIDNLLRVVSQYVEHGVKTQSTIVELRLRIVDLEATKNNLELTME